MAGWKDRSYFYQISVEDNKLFLFEIVFFFTKLRRNQSRNIYDLDNSVVIWQGFSPKIVRRSGIFGRGV